MQAQAAEHLLCPEEPALVSLASPELMLCRQCLCSVSDVMTGIKDEDAAAGRAAWDDALAASMRAGGLRAFVDSWYSAGMWSTLRAHPRCA